ncbi:carbohydrate esterase family 5 protein [Daldinia decipiens]|uniref:carbohydrate esterase family 5 protein n=1 Tax=Daldinia decipiens TaxID=326647 RepID=UPI0020C302ED|nr:carbohydrate esterase family 5 protein [Daldinia decipiens]KAI1661686.1 carbohydrate esterase family 5 protein [Daldinia decipiens]
MKVSTPLLFLSGALAAPSGNFEARQSCAKLHVIAARETTAPPGFGTAQGMIQLIQGAFPGTTSEAIVYPAAGGDSYGSSVTAGIKAVVDQVSAFTAKCPDTTVVMVGYSQGSQIMDDAFCGGPDGSSLSETAAPLPADVGTHVKAIIFMGDPRNVPGLSYNVGTAKAGGFAARPSGFQCPVYEDSIQSYCDAEDPFCSNGNSAQHHQEYVQIYGQQALAFVQQKVGSI